MLLVLTALTPGRKASPSVQGPWPWSFRRQSQPSESSIPLADTDFTKSITQGITRGEISKCPTQCRGDGQQGADGSVELWLHQQPPEHCKDTQGLCHLSYTRFPLSVGADPDFPGEESCLPRHRNTQRPREHLEVRSLPHGGGWCKANKEQPGQGWQDRAQKVTPGVPGKSLRRGEMLI